MDAEPPPAAGCWSGSPTQTAAFPPPPARRPRHRSRPGGTMRSPTTAGAPRANHFDRELADGQREQQQRRTLHNPVAKLDVAYRTHQRDELVHERWIAQHPHAVEPLRLPGTEPGLSIVIGEEQVGLGVVALKER